MKIKIRPYLLLLGVLMFGCSTNSIPPEGIADSPMQLIWQNFSEAAKNKDLKSLQELSAPCIYCPDCVENTEAEATAFEKYRQQFSETWHDDLYTKLAYIDASQFQAEDFPIIFSEQLLARISDSERTQFITSGYSNFAFAACLKNAMASTAPETFEVLVTVVDPDLPQIPGYQAVFMFAKLSNGYKFAAYSTVP